MQLAAEQQAPIAQAEGPVQSVVQVFPAANLPLTGTVAAAGDRVRGAVGGGSIAHDCGPEQLTAHDTPEQAIGPAHELPPEQVIMFMLPAPVTPPLHDAVP